MKVLFLSHIYKGKHDILIKGISEVLNSHNYSIDYEPQESVAYDCIFVFNRKILQKYETMLCKVQSPVIYLFCLSDVAEEYIVSNLITQTIIIKDTVLNTFHFSDALVLYQDMFFPSYIIPPKSIHHNEKPLIYIRIENNFLDELTFFKLLPLLNQIDNYMIHYQSNCVNGHLINPHIKIIPRKQDIREKINKADMVIGSGIIAVFAIQQGKKTVVVGERGYGGLVTNENLEYHISNCFQGRNGGKLDENIPHSLVVKDIEAAKNDTKEILEQFSLIQTKSGNKFIQQIEKTILTNNRIRINDSTLKYLFNPDYDIFKRKRRIWLSKQIFNTLYKSVNESESAVICAFKQPHSIPEVLNKFPSIYEKDINEYIHKLIEEKILIPL